MNNVNRSQIAWQIAYNLMVHSIQQLTLTITYPCAEQYTCLYLRRADADNHTNGISINMFGESILLSDGLLHPYQKLYARSRLNVLQALAVDLGVHLSEKPIRSLPSMEFLMLLVIDDQVEIKPVRYNWRLEANGQEIGQIDLETNRLTTSDGHKFDLSLSTENAFSSIRRLVMQSDYQRIVANTRELLQEKSEWRNRYLGYANQIAGNHDLIKAVRATFHEWSPLYLYLNVSNAKNAGKSVSFELRYLGQTVAKLTAKGKITISTAGFGENNKRDFDCELTLSNDHWDGIAARAFRSYFKTRPALRNSNSNKGNDEHRVESLMLTEFTRVKNKRLRQIKPVMIGGIRFPMPTPLSASNHKQIKYSGAYGGGIDILARTGTGGKATQLCIMELKDENTLKEPPREVMKQAVAYATFVRELLRSDAGPGWWKLMGFGGKIPKRLVLYAAVVMPFGKNPDQSFASINLPIEDDIIQLHYLYFEEDQNSVGNFQTSLRELK
jgi:hypothetical protein